MCMYKLYNVVFRYSDTGICANKLSNKTPTAKLWWEFFIAVLFMTVRLSIRLRVYLYNAF